MESRKKAILAVDDSRAILEEYKRILGPKYDIITFTGTSDALEKMLECKNRGDFIDLLLTDYDMGTRQLAGDDLIRQAHKIMPTKYLISTSARKEYIDDILEILRDEYEGIEVLYMAKSREPVAEIDADALLKTVKELIGE